MEIEVCRKQWTNVQQRNKRKKNKKEKEKRFRRQRMIATAVYMLHYYIKSNKPEPSEKQFSWCVGFFFCFIRFCCCCSHMVNVFREWGLMFTGRAATTTASQLYLMGFWVWWEAISCERMWLLGGALVFRVPHNHCGIRNSRNNWSNEDHYILQPP